MLKGFKEFIMRGNVVDLAIAVVIGAAFGAVVKALVEDFVTPLIAAIAGKSDFSKLTFTLNDSTFKYGDFINAVVSFLLIAAAIYFAIVLPLNTLAQRRAAKVAAGEPDPEPRPEDIILLEQIRDLLAGQAPSAVAPQASRPQPS
jgi:large conductance mechanosensitive channel